VELFIYDNNFKMYLKPKEVATNSIVLCPTGLALIEQTPSGDTAQVSWPWK